MSQKKLKLTDYYEEEGDPLAQFRARYGGGFVESEGNVPFAKDIDVIQAERTDKMDEDFRNAGF